MRKERDTVERFGDRIVVAVFKVGHTGSENENVVDVDDQITLIIRVTPTITITRRIVMEMKDEHTHLPS